MKSIKSFREHIVDQVKACAYAGYSVQDIQDIFMLPESTVMGILNGTFTKDPTQTPQMQSNL